MNANSRSTFRSPEAWVLESHRQLPVIPRDTWRRRIYLRLRAAATESTGSLMVVIVTFGMLAALLTSGCSGSAASHPVDPPLAREALKTVLESWKHGDVPETLRSAPTPITVQDLDWMGGATLINYEIVDEGKPLDANLSIPVKLTLSGGAAKKKAQEKKSQEKTVYYLVTTSPATTVFRDMFKP